MQDPDFEALLKRQFKLEALERQADVVYGMWTDTRLAYTNREWLEFARAEGAPDIEALWPIGSRVSDAIPGSLQGFYESTYEAVLDSGRETYRFFECSSPERFRRYRMAIYPVAGEGLLVVNTKVVDRPHDRVSVDPPDGGVAGDYEYCVNCRCVRDPERDSWIWIPAWVAEPPEAMRDALCPSCEVWLNRQTS